MENNTGSHKDIDGTEGGINTNDTTSIQQYFKFYSKL